MGNTKRAIIFSLIILPFMLNIALIDFMIPIKYDIIIDNLPFFGLLITIAWFASSLFDFSVGDITDRLGVRKTIQAGVIISVVGAVIFAFSSNFLIMTFGVFIWGLSYVLLTIPSDTYIFSAFSKKYSGSAYGWMYFFFGLAYALAPLIGYFIVTYFSVNSAILAAAIISAFTLPLIFLIRSRDKERFVEAVDNVVRKDGVILKELKDISKMNFREICLLINMFICGMWFMIVMFGAPLLFFHEEKNLLHGALLTFAFMLPFAFMDLGFGKLANSEKKRLLMIKWGLIIASLLLFVFYFTTNFYLLLALAIITTFTANMAWTSSEIHVSEYLPKGRKGEFMGIFVTGKDMGFNLAPLIYGFFAAFNLKLPFLIIGAILFFAWMLFMFAYRRKR